jgi:hypothetical protein
MILFPAADMTVGYCLLAVFLPQLAVHIIKGLLAVRLNASITRGYRMFQPSAKGFRMTVSFSRTAYSQKVYPGGITFEVEPNTP